MALGIEHPNEPRPEACVREGARHADAKRLFRIAKRSPRDLQVAECDVGFRTGRVRRDGIPEVGGCTDPIAARQESSSQRHSFESALRACCQGCAAVSFPVRRVILCLRRSERGEQDEGERSAHGSSVAEPPKPRAAPVTARLFIRVAAASVVLPRARRYSRALFDLWLLLTPSPRPLPRSFM